MNEGMNIWTDKWMDGKMKTIYLSAYVTGYKNRHQDTHGKTELHYNNVITKPLVSMRRFFWAPKSYVKTDG